MELGSQPIEPARTTHRLGVFSRIEERSMLLWMIPFGIAAMYVVIFLAQLPHNLWVLDWDSDYSSGYTVTTAIAEAGTAGHTVLGTSGAWAPLWFGLLTVHLPLHRELWELAPTGLFVLAAAAVAWSVAQVANRRVAMLAALLIVVAPPRALYFFMAAVAHNVVYPGTALLGAYLVWLAKSEQRRMLTICTVAALNGIVLGACIASDALLIATGLVPFAITGLLAGLRRDRRSRIVAASTLATTVIAIPVAKLTSAIMTSSGYVILTPSNALAPLSLLPRHAELMWEGLRGLMNGYLRQASSSAPGRLLGFVCEVMTAAALATVLVVGVIATVKFVAAAARRRERSAFEVARSLHVIFWVGSAGCTSIAWAASTRVEYIHESYYATLMFSVAAIVALLANARSRLRWLVPAGASIFFAASIVGLANHYLENYELPLARSYQLAPYLPTIAHHQAQIEHFAKSNGVVVGYAGYGQAASLTWGSGEHLQARPVQLCNGPQGVDICPSFVERVPWWYTPAKRRTFLVVDTDEVFLSALPEHLGKPLAVGDFGPVQMYIYPYDLASVMGPPSD
jgi:hypothetical protein